MDYRFARAFIATAESRSFSKAAKELRIAQSAVSRQIKLLEESVGAQLFFRSNKEVRLSERGEQLFAKLGAFHNWVEHQYHNAQAEIRVTALDGLMTYYVVPRVKNIEFSERIKIHLKSSNHPDIEAALNRGDVDIALTYLPVRTNGFVCRKIYEQTMVVISSRPIKTLDLSKDCWIHMGRAEFLKKLVKVHHGSEIIVNSISNIIKLVRDGLGVAVVPESYIRDGEGLHVKQLKDVSKIYLIARDFTIVPKEFKRILIALQK